MENIRGKFAHNYLKRVLSWINYSRAWFLWFIQNTIVLIVMVLYIVHYFFLGLWHPPETSLLIINVAILTYLLFEVFVILAFILDLSVVMIILLIFFEHYRNLTHSSQDSRLPLIIVVSGICWIVISIVWRIPYVLFITLIPGFGDYFVFSFLSPEIVNPVPILLSMSGFSLFIFLKYQDMFFSSKETFPYSRTGYGLLVFVGDLSLAFFTMIFVYYYFSVLIFVIKLGVTPLIGMLVAHRIFTEENERAFS